MKLHRQEFGQPVYVTEIDDHEYAFDADDPSDPPVAQGKAGAVYRRARQPREWYFEPRDGEGKRVTHMASGRAWITA